MDWGLRGRLKVCEKVYAFTKAICALLDPHIPVGVALDNKGAGDVFCNHSVESQLVKHFKERDCGRCSRMKVRTRTIGLDSLLPQIGM